MMMDSNGHSIGHWVPTGPDGSVARDMYFDPDGNEIDMMTWARMSGDRGSDGPWRVNETIITRGLRRCSTVWVGLNYNFLHDGPPLIYETMIFGGRLDGVGERYATRAQAEAGHARYVQLMRTDPTIPLPLKPNKRRYSSASPRRRYGDRYNTPSPPYDWRAALREARRIDRMIQRARQSS